MIHIPSLASPRASARTLVLCLVFLRMHYCCADPDSRCAAPRHSLCDHQLKPKRTHSNRTCKRSEPAHPHTNPIVPRAASFKSLYLKRPYTRIGPVDLHAWASDTALSGGPPLGCYVTLKLCQSSNGVVQPAGLCAVRISVTTWPAAKAAISLERFCPTLSMARYGRLCRCGGVVLKRRTARPDGEIGRFRRPGRATLNQRGGLA